jgi:PadR family transcriptional regulator, regulatory protein PadR
MCDMGSDPGMTELRRGVLGPCVLALLDERPRFGLELVRDLAAAGGLLTSEGTVYPLLNRLRDARLVTSEWRDQQGERARRYYFLTDAGRGQLKAFRADWADFASTVESVLYPSPAPAPLAVENRADNSEKLGDSGSSVRDAFGEGAHDE